MRSEELVLSLSENWSRKLQSLSVWPEIHVVGIWVMFGLLSLLMCSWCEWSLWGRNCQHLLVSQLLQLNPISPFFPGTAGASQRGLTREVISTRLSRMLLVDQLCFLHHPFHWISSWVLEHLGSLCDGGIILAVDTLDPSLYQDQITQGWDCLQWDHSWNLLVYPDQGLALDQQWQPIMQYFLLMGNLKCFVYIILNCIQTMCPLLLH